MMRLLHFIAIRALIASAGYAYSIKYETLYLRRAGREAEIEGAAGA